MTSHHLLTYPATEATPTDLAALDHIEPYSLGGPPTVENLRLVHDLCNMRRGVGRGEK